MKITSYGYHTQRGYFLSNLILNDQSFFTKPKVLQSLYVIKTSYEKVIKNHISLTGSSTMVLAKIIKLTTKVIVCNNT